MEFHCIRCGADANLLLHLGDCETLTCASCGNEFTTDDVDATIRNLQKLIRVCKATKKSVDAD